MTNDRFRESLWIDFGDYDIETKTELDILMRRPRSSYRQKKHTTEDVEDARFYKSRGMKVQKEGDHYEYMQPVAVTQDQLDSAWNYLKGKDTRNYIGNRDDYRPPSRQVHYYHRQIVVRDKKTGRFVKMEEE